MKISELPEYSGVGGIADNAVLAIETSSGQVQKIKAQYAFRPISIQDVIRSVFSSYTSDAATITAANFVKQNGMGQIYAEFTLNAATEVVAPTGEVNPAVTLGTLASGFRPYYAVNALVAGPEGVTTQIGRVRIDRDGTVTLTNIAVPSTTTLAADSKFSFSATYILR